MILKNEKKTDFVDEFTGQWKEKGIQGEPFDTDTVFLFRVMRLAGLLEQTLTKECMKYDLTWAQFQAMAAMKRLEPKALTANELMQACFLSSGSITNLINQLLAKDLIRKKQNSEDKRQLQLSLTPGGARLFDKIHKVRMKELSELAALVSKSEQKRVSESLKKILIELE